MTAPHARPDASSLLTAVRSRDPLAIARAITAIENRTSTGNELAVAVRGQVNGCRTLGVTGPPGAGKSSLINALVQEMLPHYPRTAILTVDPSSPISGGAVLGDRVRMAEHSANPNVFIRSLATRGHLGGVTRMTRSVMDLLAAGGMDLVIVETVGTGQSEVEVAELTNVKIVVNAPGLGDEMQAIKAGFLEIADILVVNKSDLPDAARTAAHLNAMLHHRGHDEHRSVVCVSTVTRDGLKALADAIEIKFAQLAADSTLVVPRTASARLLLARAVADRAEDMIARTVDPRIDVLVEDIAAGLLSRQDGARTAIGLLGELRPVSNARD